jgi:predicted KAP-like P-loop ATPase
MNKSDVKEIMNLLFDFPVNDAEILVDRKDKISYLNDIAEFQPKGIYGICGETGIGKTTVLNFIGLNYHKKLFLKITERENRESIIADFLYKLSKSVLNTEKSKLAKDSMDFVIKSKTFSKSFESGLNGIFNAKLSKAESQTIGFNLYEAFDRIEAILRALSLKRKVLIIVDEIDKEKKKDVISILDSLKDVLNLENVITFISLPFSIYREYSMDRMRWNESGNLENIFKDVIFLDPLSESDIESLLKVRLKDYNDVFSTEVLKHISRFSDGNPRDALWIAQRIVFMNRYKNKIETFDAVETIKRAMKEHFAFRRPFTEKQMEILKKLKNGPMSKSQLIKILPNLKPQTIYTHLRRMRKEGIILEKDSFVDLSGKIYYYID